MFRKEGLTLMEIVVVLVIIGIAICVFVPYFTAPNEGANAANAQNNLLAIYSAQQNYNNNNGNYCLAGTCDTLAEINTALSLSIQDDGTYLYSCSGSTCAAKRNNASLSPVITITINTPVQLNIANANPNPICTYSTANTNWCPSCATVAEVYTCG